jgi:lipoate-protein ligase A
MIFLPHSYPCGPENLALEELLLRPLVKSPSVEPIVRLWDNPEICIVLGRAEKAEQQIRLSKCQQRGIPFYRRVSGGGTVTHGPGNMNLSFFLPFTWNQELKNLKTSYHIILKWVQNAIKNSCGAETHINGTCDLCIGDKKISGTAQARKRFGILHHLTLLVDFDTSIIAKVQSEPEKQPDYREKRSHDDFITTLEREGYKLDRANFITELKNTMGGWHQQAISQSLDEEVKTLAQHKYRSSLWNRDGREPKAT